MTTPRAALNEKTNAEHKHLEKESVLLEWINQNAIKLTNQKASNQNAIKLINQEELKMKQKLGKKRRNVTLSIAVQKRTTDTIFSVKHSQE